jgi:hypothetical protein
VKRMPLPEVVARTTSRSQRRAGASEADIVISQTSSCPAAPGREVTGSQ